MEGVPASDHSHGMNTAALASAMAEVDKDLLDVLLKLKAIHEEMWPWHPGIPAITHAMETIACLSAGIEEIAARISQEGPDNPSWN